ncbi:hypothetical protein A2U01_0116338, partial [Trifolium medium]|nr:hypothetical protein [Trifolium medium]
MGRIADFFGAPEVPNNPNPRVQNVLPVQNEPMPDNQGQNQQPVVQEQQAQVEA